MGELVAQCSLVVVGAVLSSELLLVLECSNHREVTRWLERNVKPTGTIENFYVPLVCSLNAAATNCLIPASHCPCVASFVAPICSGTAANSSFTTRISFSMSWNFSMALIAPSLCFMSLRSFLSSPVSSFPPPLVSS